MKKTKYYLLTAAKVLVSAGLLYWVLQGANLKEIFETIKSANVLLLLAAFSTFILGYFLTATRWLTLLRAQGADAPMFLLIQSYMVALFFNNFLPSLIGGDVVRVYDSWRISKSKSQAVTVIFVDRFLGLLALVLLALSAMLLSDTVAAKIPLVHVWLALGAVAMLSLTLLIFYPPEWLLSGIGRMRLPLPRSLIDLLGNILKAFLSFRGRHDVLIRALSISLLLQTNVVIHFYLVAMALNFPIPFSAFFLIIPVSVLIMMVPVSINAIGVREGVFLFFFSMYGVSGSESVAFSWTIYGFILIQGLFGGLVFAFRKEITQEPASGQS